jgi:hypothetical protein
MQTPVLAPVLPIKSQIARRSSADGYRACARSPIWKESVIEKWFSDNAQRVFRLPTFHGRPLVKIAMVSFLNPQPALSLGDGNWSSCPTPDPGLTQNKSRLGVEAVLKVITLTKSSNLIALRMEYSNSSLRRSTRCDSKLPNHWCRSSFHTASMVSGLSPNAA